MPQVSIENVSIGFRGPPLLDHVSCQIESGERIGLLGRNGAGKTTLLKILSSQIPPDDGELVFAPGTKVSLLPQEAPFELKGAIREVVKQGIPPEADDQEHPWKREHLVDRVLANMNLEGDARFETLSSGMKRRVLLAQAIVAQPDVLLLDEPTNHLDLDAIEWLESFLAKWPSTLIFVTHDRTFLRKLANRILEVERGRLFDWTCDYDTFLTRKEIALAAEEKQAALFDKKLAEEEVWIRTGIKARRTRNEGRVRALEAMRRVRLERREAVGKVKVTIQQAERSGALVAEADDISFAYDGREIVRNFSTTIMRGDKIGIVGHNGAGKTTLLRLLLGELKPQSGTVRLGTNVQVAYFDQLRRQLDDESTVQECVGEGNDTIKIGDKTRHIVSYLRDFLFSPERARTKIKRLSGGERNRILLAKLFAKPANVIVLDEPTNDLDSETLELLESRLVEFEGTMITVSHDRSFLDNVVTSTLVFENGDVREYAGGYSDWVRQRAASTELESKGRANAPQKGREARVNGTTDKKESKNRGLSFKEKQELQSLPDLIETCESQIAALHEQMADPQFYKQNGSQIAETQGKLRSLEEKLATAYERWSTLEDMEK